MIEVGNQGIGQTEVVGREDELVGPSVVLLQQTVGTHSRLGCPQRADAYGTDMARGCLGIVDNTAGLRFNLHLLRAHLVLRQVFYLNGVKATQSAMDRQE